MAVTSTITGHKPAFGSRGATAMWGAFLVAAGDGTIDAITPQVLRHLRNSELVGFEQTPCKHTSSRYPSLVLEASSEESCWFLRSVADDVAEAFAGVAGEFMVGLQFVEPQGRDGWDLAPQAPRSTDFDTRRRPGVDRAPRWETFADVPTPHLLRHVRWERTETYGPQAGAGDRLAYWCSPALSRFLGTPAACTSNFNSVVHSVCGIHVDRRRQWDPDDWGDIDPLDDDNRLAVHLIGPDGGDSPSDVASILGRVDDRFRCSRSFEVGNNAPLGGLARRLLETPIGADLVLVFRGGGLRRGDYTGEPGDALRKAAQDVHARGTTVVLGVGHGSVDSDGDGRVLPPDSPFGLHELATPSLAARWIVENYVGARRASLLGHQFPGLHAEATAWWKALTRF